MLFGGWRGRINTGEHSVSSQQSHQQRRLQSSLLHGVSCLCREHSVLRPVEVVGGQRQLLLLPPGYCAKARESRTDVGRTGEFPTLDFARILTAVEVVGDAARLILYTNRQTIPTTYRQNRATGGIRE